MFHYHYPSDANRISVETVDLMRGRGFRCSFPSSPRLVVSPRLVSSSSRLIFRLALRLSIAQNAICFCLFVCLNIAFVVPPNASSLMRRLTRNQSALVMTKTLRAESALSSSDVVRCGVSYTCAHTCHKKNISVSCPRGASPRPAPRAAPLAPPPQHCTAQHSSRHSRAPTRPPNV